MTLPQMIVLVDVGRFGNHRQIAEMGSARSWFAQRRAQGVEVEIEQPDKGAGRAFCGEGVEQRAADLRRFRW